ncbi:sulfurtransferase-like selenium metabolism protein YedF [Helicovermis profundi]|uniref:Sulfurtransferase-like selenium metabolism protein YedF n=1 Tax=Helicovermis profundi TaxID=3065157 RepID=A0AAU9EE75_9FIRM|nr:sulfurtransferase-like selenium metabolism protein YedF [Clostridia bacterium S502]
MIVEIDARGLDCPKPVINTKKAIEQITEGSVITIVDNEAAKENVSKLAKKLKYEYSVKAEGDLYYISINKGESLGFEEMGDPKENISESVIYVSSDKMGSGDDTLGEILIKGYFYTLTELKPYPKAILFVNSGVNLTIDSSPVLEYIRILESYGVEVLSCGTCLDFYNITSRLSVGGISNMYSIAEHMNNAKNTIKL